MTLMTPIGSAAVELTQAHCVLMFSGGRDSTLAALRLAEAGVELALVTVIAPHLRGIAAVRRRLAELKGKLPDSTPYIEVQQPEDLATETGFYERTCLPCHHAYATVAALVAPRFGVQRLAFGYTSYQRDWPEQTPEAIQRMRSVLAESGRELLLPVQDIASKADAIAELQRRGLSGEALEQKCVRQVFNIKLPEERLKSQVRLWEGAIRESLNRLDAISLSQRHLCYLGDM